MPFIHSEAAPSGTARRTSSVRSPAPTERRAGTTGSRSESAPLPLACATVLAGTATGAAISTTKASAISTWTNGSQGRSATAASSMCRASVCRAREEARGGFMFSDVEPGTPGAPPLLNPPPQAGEGRVATPAGCLSSRVLSSRYYLFVDSHRDEFLDQVSISRRDLPRTVTSQAFRAGHDGSLQGDQRTMESVGSALMRSIGEFRSRGAGRSQLPGSDRHGCRDLPERFGGLADGAVAHTAPGQRMAAGRLRMATALSWARASGPLCGGRGGALRRPARRSAPCPPRQAALPTAPAGGGASSDALGRARQIGLLSLVGDVLDLHQHQPRPRARQIAQDRLARALDRSARLAVLRQIFAEPLAREQALAGQRFEHQCQRGAARIDSVRFGGRIRI